MTDHSYRPDLSPSELTYLEETPLDLPVPPEDPQYALWQLWSIHRTETGLLPHDKLDVLALRHLFGKINVVDIDYGYPPRFRFRLHGTGGHSHMIPDLTGQTFQALNDLNYAEMVQRHFVEVLKLGLPTRMEIFGHLTPPRGARGPVIMHYRRLLIPATTSGNRLDMIVSASLRYDDDTRTASGLCSPGINQSQPFLYRSERRPATAF